MADYISHFLNSHLIFLSLLGEASHLNICIHLSPTHIVFFCFLELPFLLEQLVFYYIIWITCRYYRYVVFAYIFTHTNVINLLVFTLKAISAHKFEINFCHHIIRCVVINQIITKTKINLLTMFLHKFK